MATTLSPQQIVDLADQHHRAWQTATAFERPTRRHPDMTIDDAYAVQSAWVAAQVAGGAAIVGHKIGLTSRAMQQAMRIDEPDFGVLLDHMVVANGATIDASRYIDPKVEVELAFVLGERLDLADPTVEHVYAATDRIVPALELIDARSHRVDPVDGTPRTVRDTISDNAADSGLVLGDRSLQPGERDLRWVAAICSRNGIVEETGTAAGVLGDPVLGVVWLARRLHAYGVALEAGEVILAGSFTRPIDLRPGDDVEADFGDLGTVSITVTR